MSFSIDVFTQPNCESCLKIKTWMQEKNIPYTEKDIVNDPAANKEFGEAGQKFVPYTVISIKDKTLSVVGPNTKKIDNILRLNGAYAKKK